MVGGHRHRTDDRARRAVGADRDRGGGRESGGGRPARGLEADDQALLGPGHDVRITHVEQRDGDRLLGVRVDRDVGPERVGGSARRRAARGQQTGAGQTGCTDQHGAAADRVGTALHGPEPNLAGVEPRHRPPDGSARLVLQVDGVEVDVPDRGTSLLDVLRDDLGLRSVKDGCSPQGQCGCCTVLVDDAPRVACVTPARRVAGRSVDTVHGLGAEVRDRWAAALVATGGSQCGFCTPGVIVRLEGLRRRPGRTSPPSVDEAAESLRANLCRCTGWRTILEAYELVVAPGRGHPPRQLVRRRPSGGDRGRHAAGAGPRRHPRQRQLRRRRRPRRRARRRARRAGRVGPRGDRRGGPSVGRQGAGAPDHGRVRASARPASGRLGSHAAHVVGRARLPRTRRVVVRARW